MATQHDINKPKSSRRVPYTVAIITMVCMLIVGIVAASFDNVLWHANVGAILGVAVILGGLMSVLVLLVVIPLVALTTHLFRRGKEEIGTQCRRCGYQLIYNSSGRCPECGEVVSADVSAQLEQIADTARALDDIDHYARIDGKDTSARSRNDRLRD